MLRGLNPWWHLLLERENPRTLQVLSRIHIYGREAVDFLEQNTDVDVVLTDIIMPRMNGLELAEYILSLIHISAGRR